MSNKGRAAIIDARKVRELRDQGLGGSVIAQRLGMSRASVYRVLDAS